MGRLGFLGLVTQQPLFQERDGGAEVVAEPHQEVDVVEVLTAAEAVGEIVLGVVLRAFGEKVTPVTFKWLTSWNPQISGRFDPRTDTPELLQFRPNDGRPYRDSS